MDQPWDNLSLLLQIVRGLALVGGGIAVALAPLFWLSKRILAPIDRAAKFRKSPVRFSIGDFLCLFLAIQIPLAAVHGFLSDDTMQAYWAFTIVTWVVGPIVWYAGARTLSKAQIKTSSHRFIFLGLIMPLVYYGLVPFSLLGLGFCAPLVGQFDLPLRWMLPTWMVLAAMFYLSARFVSWMLQQVPAAQSPISDQEHDNKLFRAAMFDTASATPVSGPNVNG
jgi:hypothetical protein